MYTTLMMAMMVAAPPQPVSAFAPVLHVRLVTPPDYFIALRPGVADGRMAKGEATFAVRPGYIVRLGLNKGDPNSVAALHPSLEVRSTLFLPSNLRGENFPAFVRVSEDDLQHVAAGSMITKVIYLENPETAVPVQATCEQPLERDALRGEDAFELAKSKGRVLAILRLGGRSLTQEELIAEDVDGVIQQPGEVLGPPSRPPVLAARTFQQFDPRSGPRVPTEEFVPDGGDNGPRIGIAPNGHLGNLDTTDTGVEFRYGREPRRTATSNLVCLFAPRFGTIRQDTTPASHDSSLPPVAVKGASGPNLERTRLPAISIHEITPPMAVLSKLSPRGMRSREGTHELDVYLAGPQVIGRIDGVLMKATVIEPITLTQYRDQCKQNDPLVLVKSADPREAVPGDVVTFTLKVINYGSRPAREIIVSDALSPRLEYVAGSSCGDRPTIFTQETNEQGTVILRWVMNGEIPPGQSGTVQFRVRVR